MRQAVSKLFLGIGAIALPVAASAEVSPQTDKPASQPQIQLLLQTIENDVEGFISETVIDFARMQGIEAAIGFDVKAHATLAGTPEQGLTIEQVTILVNLPADEQRINIADLDTQLKQTLAEHGFATNTKTTNGRHLAVLKFGETQTHSVVNSFFGGWTMREYFVSISLVSGSLFVLFLGILTLRQRRQRKTYAPIAGATPTIEPDFESQDFAMREEAEGGPMVHADPALDALAQLPVDDALAVLRQFSDNERQEIIASLDLHPALQARLRRGVAGL